VLTSLFIFSYGRDTQLTAVNSQVLKGRRAGTYLNLPGFAEQQPADFAFGREDKENPQNNDRYSKEKPEDRYQQEPGKGQDQTKAQNKKSNHPA